MLSSQLVVFVGIYLPISCLFFSVIRLIVPDSERYQDKFRLLLFSYDRSEQLGEMSFLGEKIILVFVNDVTPKIGKVSKPVPCLLLLTFAL